MDAETIYDMLERGQDMPDGLARVELMEEATRGADALQDARLQFYTRGCLIQASFCAGQPDKMYTALSWCLSRSEERPNDVDWHCLLWQCKHALSYSTSFYTLSRKQIAGLTSDVIDRYRSYGASLRGPYTFVMVCHMAMGDKDEAREYHDRWQSAEIDEFADGAEWETYFEADYLVFNERMDEALELSLDMLGQPSVFTDVFPWLGDLFLLEFLKRGEPQQAEALYRQCYRLCHHNPKFLPHVGQLIGFLVYTRNFDKALEVFNRHFAWRRSETVPGARLGFDLWAWTLMRHLHEAGRETVELEIPAEFALQQKSGRYSTADLATRFLELVEDLTAKFDERNGNDSSSSRIAKTQALDSLVTDYPMR